MSVRTFRCALEITWGIEPVDGLGKQVRYCALKCMWPVEGDEAPVSVPDNKFVRASGILQGSFRNVTLRTLWLFSSASLDEEYNEAGNAQSRCRGRYVGL